MGRSKSQGKVILAKQETPVLDTRDIDPPMDKKAKRIPNPDLMTDIAGDHFYHKNWYYPGGRDAFPLEPHLWYVDRFYPAAKCGPLLIDEPSTKGDIVDCERKKKAIKAGLKYLIIKRGMTFELGLCELEMEYGVDNCADGSENASL